MKIPHERYSEDVQGMPCFAATEKFVVNVSGESMAGAVPADDENCAIALGCKAQLQTPYVSVGRSRTDLALPHPQGVQKPGYGDTKWAVIRFRNSQNARKIIVAADTGTLAPEGAIVELLRPIPAERPKNKKARNKDYSANKYQSRKKKSEKDDLTEMGVRILTGQRRR